MDCMIKPFFNEYCLLCSHGCWLYFCKLIPPVFKLNSEVIVDSSVVLFGKYTIKSSSCCSIKFPMTAILRLWFYCIPSVVPWDEYVFQKDIGFLYSIYLCKSHFFDQPIL